MKRSTARARSRRRSTTPLPAACWAQSPAHRGDPSRHAQPADGAVLDRRRISRGLRDRHRAVGSVRQGLQSAGAPDARRLCRDKQRIYNTCAGTQYVRSTNISPVSNWNLGAAKGPMRPRRLHEPRRRTGRKPAGKRHLGDEDLAVRSGGRRRTRASTSPPPR